MWSGKESTAKPRGKMGHSCEQNPTPTVLQAHFIILELVEKQEKDPTQTEKNLSMCIIK